MVYAFIGAMIVVVLLLAFSVVGIIWICRSVGKNIRSKTVEILSSYDEVLDEKSEQLTAILSQMPDENKVRRRYYSREEQASSISSSYFEMIERMNMATGKKVDIGNVYKDIKRNFKYSPSESYKEIPNEEISFDKGTATGILDMISFETFYKLSVLGAKEQYDLVSEMFDDKQKKVLETFCPDPTQFSAIAFYDYLNQRASEEPKPCVMKVAAGNEDLDVPEGVTVEVDEGLCEGFQLETGKRMYDYGIRIKEMV